jgi:hypothetical protein
MKKKTNRTTNILWKSTLTILSVSLFTTLMAQVHADVNNPIINPTDPTQTINPEENTSITNETTSEPGPVDPPSDQSADRKDKETVRLNLLPSLRELANFYNYTEIRTKKKSKIDQVHMQITLPTDNLDLAIGGGDDKLNNSMTGYMMSSISGLMIFGR